jgi:uncharacterized protein YgiM (DUF1202 family)
MIACDPAPPRAPVIGEAYAGPANLPIRKEIAPKSATVGTVHYPEKLQIVQQHRHFVKVRTKKGVEGWTDERLLLDETAFNSLKQLSSDMQRYPSQGLATTYDLLNVHTEPQRQSPSYMQIQPNERVDVIAHRLVSKTAPQRKTEMLIRKPAAPNRKKKEKKVPKIPLPPAPAPPKPPADWVQLSKDREPEPEPKQEKDEPEPAAPDDWTLIRNKSGESGWVLTRRIFMAIPDEVAQYAEGKRITSYFSLGKVRDEEKTKDIWLWTTIGGGAQAYDFDGFRVFVWSLRHHRYETAYIQRRMIGYYPVRAGSASFSVAIEKDDGKRYRQSFSMEGNRVKFDGEREEPTPRQVPPKQ